MKKFSVFSLFLSLLILVICMPLIVLTGCNKTDEPSKITVYDIASNKVTKMDFNHYIEGVVNAEIGETAPLEALKAQAVLARTFTLDFLKHHKSKYVGADISNDITEAQAYKETSSAIIKQAVKETKGETVKYNGEYISAYFFSNSGGKTALATEGANYLSENPEYIKSVDSPENDQNSQNYTWTASISKSKVLNALRDMGISLASISSFKKGEISQSGRAKTFIIGGKEVDANTFRLAVGSTTLKSTLIDKITVSTSTVSFEGRGYGHGIGLSQEGAVVLANQGKNYKEIISYYFNNIQITK